MNHQAPSAVVMVRPTRFVPNPQTIADNLFQPRQAIAANSDLSRRAYDEVTAMACALRTVGVEVHLFDDDHTDRPDSVFPNNWLSTHPDGRVALYPMYSDNRRNERRPDIVNALRATHRISGVHDYSVLEDDNLYLEGTGSMVLDHVHRTAYIARSFRSHDRAAAVVCRDLDYRPILFDTRDQRGAPIYHTNVMMSLGTELALVGLESIHDRGERQTVESELSATGREILELGVDQLDNFLGNTIEVNGIHGRHLVISQRAVDALRPAQRERIEAHVSLLPISVPTIELAGGSVRCMVAGIHLPARELATATRSQGSPGHAETKEGTAHIALLPEMQHTGGASC